MKELNQMKMKMKMIEYVNRIFLEWHKLESKESDESITERIESGDGAVA